MKILKDLPPWAKGVIAVSVTAAVGFAGYKIYMLIKKKNAIEKQDAEIKKSVKDEIADLENSGHKPSYKDSEYNQYAEIIHSSMKFCVGDNYTLVEETLKKMKNDLDVAKLVQAFGKRKDYCFGVPVGEYNLFAYVQKELGDENLGLTSWWKNRVKNINTDWKAKGITYTI